MKNNALTIMLHSLEDIHHGIYKKIYNLKKLGVQSKELEKLKIMEIETMDMIDKIIIQMEKTGL